MLEGGRPVVSHSERTKSLRACPDTTVPATVEMHSESWYSV